MARSLRGERIVMGCAGAAFASVWSATFLFVALVIVNGKREGDLGGTKASLVIHELVRLSPFVFVAVVFWVLVAIQFARARNRPAGRATVRRTPSGWRATFPNWVPALLAALAFQFAILATILVPGVLINRRNPLWVWYIAGPVAVALAAFVYRWRDYQPTVVIDENARELTLPLGRKLPAVTVSWAAITDVATERIEFEESDRYDCVVTATHNGEPLAVRLYGDADEEEMGRFVAWLRASLGLPPVEPVRAKD